MAAASPLEHLLVAADQALRSLFAPSQAARPFPSPATSDLGASKLTDSEKRQSAALMRVNHAGEVSAQALYHGQALFARDNANRDMLLRAAREEADHLAWCEQRIQELGGRTSVLNPLFYAGSFAIGALAAAVNDKVSLGFVSETERQVEKHLEDHLAKLPPADRNSRAVLESMKHDEIHHGEAARAAGGADLPEPVKALMFATSRVMTVTSYWI